MQRGIVWVVDDDSSIRWVLERALAGAGLTCTTFENGAEQNAGCAAFRYPYAGNGRAGATQAD